MTSIGTMATGKHVPKWLLSKVGFRLLVLLLISTLIACYTATYREVPSAGTGISPFSKGFLIK